MIGQGGSPSLGRWVPRAAKIFGHDGLCSFDSQLAQFAVSPWCFPQLVRLAHVRNQVATPRRISCSSNVGTRKRSCRLTDRDSCLAWIETHSELGEICQPFWKTRVKSAMRNPESKWNFRSRLYLELNHETASRMAKGPGPFVLRVITCVHSGANCSSHEKYGRTFRL